jgi:TusA-related sulfurtransferase
MSIITIKVIGADNKMSKHITESIDGSDGYKYTYLRQLVSRLRILKSNIQDLPEAEQITILGNILITERNIANYAAEKYAELNQEELFDCFMSIVSDIEECFE